MNDPRPRILFIVNPRSGRKEKSMIVALASKILAERFDLNIRYTTHKGHAYEIAKEAVAEGFESIVAVGGDGTVNEIGKALVHTDIAMGIIPCGSGNGLALDLGYQAFNPLKAIEAIKHHHTKHIDYGLVDNVPFFCTCGIGFDARVSQLFAHTKHRGFIKYIYLTIQEYFRYKGFLLHIEHDGEILDKEAFILNCANIRQLGNYAFIAPEADMQDGLLNITLLKPFGFFSAFRLAWRLFTKQIDHIHITETFTCPELRLIVPEGAPFHYDGEPMYIEGEILIKIVPKGLKVIVPQKTETDGQ